MRLNFQSIYVPPSSSPSAQGLGEEMYNCNGGSVIATKKVANAREQSATHLENDPLRLSAPSRQECGAEISFADKVLDNELCHTNRGVECVGQLEMADQAS